MTDELRRKDDRRWEELQATMKVTSDILSTVTQQANDKWNKIGIDIAVLQTNVLEIKKELVGNGEPGLKKKVARLYKYVYMIMGGAIVIGFLWTVFTFVFPYINHKGLPL